VHPSPTDISALAAGFADFGAGAPAGPHAPTPFAGWASAGALALVVLVVAVGAGLATWLLQRQERKRRDIEDALRWSREKLDLALRSAQVGTWTWNREKDVSDSDEYLPKLFGVDGPLRSGLKSVQPFVVPEDWPKLISSLLSCQSVGSVLDTEFRVRWPDGSLHYLSVRGQAFADEKGLPNRLTGVCQDVTERHLAREALQLSQDQLALAVQSAYIGTWEWDIRANRSVWDARMHALFDLDQDGFEGTYEAVAALIHPEDQVRVREEIGQCIQDRTDLDTEYRIITPKGVRRTLATKGRVYCDDSGQPSRFIGICLDLTRQKQDEEQLRATAAELAKTNKELELFAYAASHDLQEPVRAVSGCAELLHRRHAPQLDESARELINHILDGAARMRALISDLLAYSRVGTARSRPMTRVELEPVWAATLASLNLTISETQASVTHDLPLPAIQGDATQLGQLFQNLLSNALKYRSEAPPKIHLAVQPAAGEWHFTLSDNGIGIEPQYFERIFVLFQRLHTRAHSPGTGIGLALCQKIVEIHGGRIWVESEPGQGSKFHFTFPNHQ